MTEQEKTFLPLLNEFCNKTDKFYKKNGIYGLFFPNVLPEYGKREKRYFYVGQDTYYWIDFDKMLEYYHNNDLLSYINENNSILTSDKILEYSGNNAGAFWTMVIRLHIYLYTGKIINVNLIKDDEKDLLKNIGWGNLNSIEVPKTLMNEGFWDDLDQSIYWEIKNESIVFDKLKYILDIYNPEIIFIFNWDDTKEKDAFSGLEYEWFKDQFIDKIISIYKIKNYNTFVIWCPHPNNLSWKKLSIDKLIKIIEEKMKEIKLL